MLELQRRSDAAGWHLMSNAAHPGGSLTDLVANGPGHRTGLMGAIEARFMAIIAQSPADGAWPQLFAATSPDAQPSTYYGPSRWLGLKGVPTVANMSGRARNVRDAKRLWEVSEKLAGVTF
jgi:hypothetical protein